MSWYVYILRCSDNSYYIGITNHLQERVYAHNSKKGSIYLRTKLPVKLLYSELWPNKSEARKREIQLKGWTRKKKKMLICGILK
ncbi:MAG: GIY-YIG nuclease family protein [bacterium]|nr:GIY-YIG nuclease family protein [bacterium]